MNNKEQWLSDGNCDICRRKRYCTKTCTARVKAKQRRMATAALAMSACAFSKLNTELNRIHNNPLKEV